MMIFWAVLNVSQNCTLSSRHTFSLDVRNFPDSLILQDVLQQTRQRKLHFQFNLNIVNSVSNGCPSNKWQIFRVPDDSFELCLKGFQHTLKDFQWLKKHWMKKKNLWLSRMQKIMQNRILNLSRKWNLTIELGIYLLVFETPEALLFFCFPFYVHDHHKTSH